MSPLSIVVIGILVVALFFFLFSALGKSNTDNVILVNGSQPGDREVQGLYTLPLAMNQPEGLVFSYSGWILVNDFTTGYGKERRILSKGDTPGIYIDSTSNSLVFKVKTYTTTETILIQNLPAAKWIHFAITVDQTSVNIYINGTLRQHHTLGQLPDQSNDAVRMGGDWNGVLARTVYYPRALSNDEVRKLSEETPPDDLKRPTPGPSYFDITWYIGRLNSA